MLSNAKRSRISALAAKLRYFSNYHDDDNTWQLMTVALRLYGDSVIGIEDSYTQSVEYGGTLFRNAHIVADLLDNHVLEDADTDDYFESTLQMLEPFTKAYGFYKAGLDKYRTGISERNTLDDMRLAFEGLVRNITGKEASLEKQKSNLGLALEDAGEIKYVKDLFTKMLSVYMDYHNSIIKHQEDGEEVINVSAAEVSFIVEITSAFMRYLIGVFTRKETD